MPPELTTNLQELLAVIGEQLMRIRQLEEVRRCGSSSGSPS
jgi:hypothetical protein